MSGTLNELRLQVERLDYDNKESIITIDILKEQNQDGKNELEELKKIIAELKAAQKDASAEDKEKKKTHPNGLVESSLLLVILVRVKGIQPDVVVDQLFPNLFARQQLSHCQHTQHTPWP